MKILFVSVEVAPFAKVGGLADVAASLPQALLAKGHDVRIAMPAYEMNVRDKDADLHWEAMRPCQRLASVNAYHDDLHGVPVIQLLAHPDFSRVVNSETIYSPTCHAYLDLPPAIFEYCERIGWIPDVIHCNDWHTGFVPALLREQQQSEWKSVASVFTIHNLAYQGEFGQEVLEYAGLPRSIYTSEYVEAFGSVNFLKTGSVYSDLVNTVSPNYAQEILTPEYGTKLWGFMADQARLGRVRGILNGIDTNIFNPATDPQLEQHFDPVDLDGKRACKLALQRELDLPDTPAVPIVAMITRLSEQKGFHWVLKSAYAMLNAPAQLVVLAIGDRWAADGLRDIEAEWPDRMRFIERFDAPLAQRIYAGADMFLMPSSFEPCGLGQMIALRYGTVPIVRKTGGLSDTISEPENGFVFERGTARDLVETMNRAFSAYNSQKSWDSLVRRCMQIDNGWDQRVDQYLELYEAARATRVTRSLVS